MGSRCPWFLKFAPRLLAPSSSLGHPLSAQGWPLLTYKSEAAGFLNGLKHPVSGPDQVLAMVAVGLSALNSTLRKFIAYPTLFRLSWLSPASSANRSSLTVSVDAIAATAATPPNSAKGSSSSEHSPPMWMTPCCTGPIALPPGRVSVSKDAIDAKISRIPAIRCEHTDVDLILIKKNRERTVESSGIDY